MLGSVYDPQLTSALMSMFLDPDQSLDPDFTAAAGVRLLGVVNGQRMGQLQQSSSPNPLLAAGAHAEEVSRQLLKRGKWALPDVGKAPQQPALVKGVRREVMYQQVRGGLLLRWLCTCTTGAVRATVHACVCVYSNGLGGGWWLLCVD